MSSSGGFAQSGHIRDVVFPFFLVSRTQDSGVKADSFQGTGFLIGSRGFALTAGHVAQVIRGVPAVAGFVGTSGGWYGFTVREVEVHPTEDIAVVLLDKNPSGQPWHSWMQPCARWDGSSREYSLWGYPEDVYYEVTVDGIARGRPDLVYSRGHIRRRLSNIPLPGIKGKHFFELSTVAGPGCSGSPVIALPSGPGWEVIGIYCGDRSSRSSSDSIPTSVGYAVRMDAVAGWDSKLLGHSIVEEQISDPSQYM